MKKALLFLFGVVFYYTTGIGANLKELAFIDKSSSGNITIIDANHDGLNEIYFQFANEPAPWPWSLWKYLGDNNYQYQTLNPPDSSRPWVAGYLDDDSLVDIVGFNYRIPYGMGVWEAPTYNSYVTNMVWASVLADSVDPWDIYITDLDQDGNKEILCRARRDYTTRIYECTSDNQYQLVYKDKPPVAAYYGGIAYGDWDSDGRMEFTFADDGAFDQIADVYTYECTGDNAYQQEAQDSVYTKGAYIACSGNDMDGDGKPEFIIGGQHNDGTNLWDVVVTLFESTGINNYSSSWSVTLQTYLSTNTGVNMGTAWDVKTGNIDGDVTCEIAIATSESLIIYKAYGNDNYQRIYQGLTGPGPYSSRLNNAALQVYDINKNGYDEVIVSGYYFVKPSGSTQYYETRIYEIMGEVTFDSLRATAKDSCIQVNWATSRQFANYGFNVWRATASSGPYNIVHSTSDTVRLDTLPQYYSHYDSTVTSGAKYFYKVQAKALNDTSIFIGPDSAMGVTSKPEDRIPNIEFRMAQNSPNPFSTQTTISYQIPKSGMVSLKVYNIQGQLVKTITYRVQWAGVYSATWDGRDEKGQASGNGVYFCKLNCNGQTQSKKIILMR